MREGTLKKNFPTTLAVDAIADQRISRHRIVSRVCALKLKLGLKAETDCMRRE